MSELENVFQSNNEFWEYVANNPRIVGIPISENKGLDLLSALKDVREAYKENLATGDTMLTILGSLLAGIADGDGEEMLEEVIVSEAMSKFDKHLREVLDEGR